MPLSVYIHIPYCLQRCRYCDFATFEQSEILPADQYIEYLKQEIQRRHRLWTDRELGTIYFGGGTPSLLPPEHIIAILEELANVGFTFSPNIEITLEINPATLDKEKIFRLIDGGVNRFSVGAQTFNDELLRVCGRKHNADDTRETLHLLKSQNVNYSFDLLFALPGQSLDDLEKDLREVAEFSPNHLSAYCLTVPEGHSMSTGRPPEGEQVRMFDRIEEALRELKLHRYEISNFAKPGFESRHNGVYWSDESYWGLGLSSHSYQRNGSENGLRFWNPKSLKEYFDQCAKTGERFQNILPSRQWEALNTNEALTDFCHVRLRVHAGLSRAALRNKFGHLGETAVLPRVESLQKRGLLSLFAGPEGPTWRLSKDGLLISNYIFEQLTFLPEDLAAAH